MTCHLNGNLTLLSKLLKFRLFCVPTVSTTSLPRIFKQQSLNPTQPDMPSRELAAAREKVLTFPPQTDTPTCVYSELPPSAAD